jgi:AraC family transcriptional activator of pobA
MDTNRTFKKMTKNENVINYNGLYGDEQGKYSSEYIFLELIATRSQTFNWVIKPHVHSHLFQIFFIQNGSLEFIHGQEKSHINAPCILLIPPTLLHGLTYTPNVEGYILSVSDGVIQDLFKSSTAFLTNCDRIHIIENFKSGKEFESITQTLHTIENELFSEHIERMIMLKALLSTLFVSLFRLCNIESESLSNSTNGKYFRKFLHLIKASGQEKSIPSYADELNISPVHLNRICKAMSGKPATELIDQNTIMEAQKYLLHTSYSISEIAYQLKFEYPNYFARKFKKHTGMTPQEFRRLDRK